MYMYMIDISTFLVIVVALLSIIVYLRSTLPTGFPPGPKPWPVIENLFHFSRAKRGLHELFIQYRKTYGDVVGFKILGQNAVMLNSLNKIQEAFVVKSDIFSSRPDLKHFFTLKANIMREGLPTGVIWQSGTNWRSIRRFALKSLRDFSFGKSTVEQIINQEAEIVCDVLMRKAKRGLDITELFQEAVSNVICSLVFGSRFEYDDPEFQRMMYCINFNIKHISFGGILNYFPILRYLPPFQWYWKNRKIYDEQIVFLEKQINKHRESFDPNQVRDYVDHCLIKESENTSNDTAFSKRNMLGSIVDLFMGGTDTTSTTICWIILYLINYPKIQKKCQMELDLIVGTSRQVAWSDKDNLPLIEALIHEVMRLRPLVPVGLPRCVDKFTTIGKYNIPKGTVVFPNIYAVHHDTLHFDQAYTFNPERWLKKDGKFQKSPAFLVFSTGPRVCLGETLARMELFLFISNLLQRFTITAADPTNVPSLEPAGGFTLRPHPYKVKVCPR